MDEPARAAYPLGVMPRRIHEEKRINDLARAIRDYLDAGILPSPEWAEELTDLLRLRGEAQGQARPGQK
jgi:hypothetical protein